MAIKTVRGYRTISGIASESLDAFIQAFVAGTGETILVGRSETLDTTISRGTRETDGEGRSLQLLAGTAKGTNQVGGDVRILTGYSTGNAAAGDFDVRGDMTPGASGTAVNAGGSSMLHLSGSTGDATFYNDIIIGGDEITNTGSDNDLILTSDKDMYFTLDRDVDSSGNKFVFRKHGSPGFTEIAELDEDGNLQIDGRLTTGLAFTSLDVDNVNINSGTIKFDDTAHNVAGGTLEVKGGSTTAGTTNNIAGGGLDLYAGAGKGTGAGGDIRLLVAPVGSSGSSLNSHFAAVTISDDLSATFTGNINATNGITFPSKNLQVDLTSTSAQGFSGASNATSIGVNGTLPVANGGTGVTSLSSLYAYQYLNWEVNTNSFTGTNYELPAANGGFGSDSFTINSGLARDTAIDGSVTISLATNLQQQGWFVPHACKLIAVSGAFRNNGSESNPRDVAIFVGTPDIGSSNNSTYTQRLFAAGDVDGGAANSKIYKVNTVLGTPFSLSAGDLIMPAVCNSTGSSTVSMQGNFNIIIATPIFTI